MTCRGRIKVAAMLGLTLGALATVPSSGKAATIEVDFNHVDVDENGICALREAMISANKNVSRDTCEKGESSRDTIKLGGGQPLGTFFLTGSDIEEDEGKDGDLDYTGGGPLTIRGKSANKTVINALAMDNRVLHATGNARALLVRDLSIVNGTAPTDNPVGGIIRVESGALTLDRVTVERGSSRLGGGLYFSNNNDPPRNLTIKRSVFAENESLKGGGIAVLANSKTTISKSTFSDNFAESDLLSEGGAIYTQAATVQISDSIFSGNRAETTDDSGFSSARGGAVSFLNGSGGARIDRSTFGQNEVVSVGDAPARGGAVSGTGLDTEIVNSTFFGNESDGTGGAVQGLGVSNDMLVAHGTFLQNTAGEAGDHVSTTGLRIVLRNSILPGAQIGVDVCDGAVESKGFNVFTYDDPGCGTLDSDVTNGGNAGLAGGPPEDNGGPTPTIALVGDSIAKDLVPKRKCKPAKGVDQRRLKRPKGPGCDAGAFEQGAQP